MVLHLSRTEPRLACLLRSPRPAPRPATSLPLQAAEAANREISGDTDEEEEFEEG